MRILVDTNILINLEDNKIIDRLFSDFYNIAISNNCKIWYHPFAIPQDIQRDRNNERRNIILDLSWNTGGNVGALYRVLGFITDSPFEVTGIDGETKGASTSFVEIGDITDYSHLNWHLLTTPTSFSAANSLANIFKANDLGDVIGVTTGGGACSITPILLPNGTAFTMSSNNISAYRTGSGTDQDPYVYHNVEFGITPDFEIDIDDIFNTQVLLEIIYNSN